jgi:hypothetical protein
MSRDVLSIETEIFGFIKQLFSIQVFGFWAINIKINFRFGILRLEFLERTLQSNKLSSEITQRKIQKDPNPHKFFGE